jgi:hypothetical protein
VPLYRAARNTATLPSNPPANTPYWDSTRDMAFFHDGTRWLSTQLFSIAAGSFSSGGTGTTWLPLPFRGTYSIWLERVDASTFVSGVGEWDVILNWTSAANVSTALATLDGSADAAATWLTKTAVPSPQLLDANARALNITWTEASGTATLIANAAIFYRVIG